MKWRILTLLILSGLSHFIFFGRPAEVVFDEVHFGNFASSYETGRYFFDVHPPLGKLLISASGFVAGYDSSSMDYASIGNRYVDERYVWYRILPNIAGFLLPLVIYLLCRKLRFSPNASLLAGLAVILENSLLVQSRFIFLDIFLLFFGFASLLFYVSARQTFSERAYAIYIVGSAVFAALAVSVKWTGMSVIGLIALVELWDLLHAFRRKATWKAFFARSAIYAVTLFIIYFTVFSIHFSLLDKSGPGDAFMSERFQSKLIGSPYWNPNIPEQIHFEKFVELNRAMWNANKTLTAEHTYSSMWYTWPVMERTIYYWMGSKKSNTATGYDVADCAADTIDCHEAIKESKIYLIGNPIIYWLSIIAALLVLSQVLSRYRSLWKDKKDRLPLLLLAGYAINWLPFMFIGRVMFLYHYLMALVFGIMLIAYSVDLIRNERVKGRVMIVLTVVFALSFLWFSPLTYGLPLGLEAQDLRFWFKSWI